MLSTSTSKYLLAGLVFTAALMSMAPCSYAEPYSAKQAAAEAKAKYGGKVVSVKKLKGDRDAFSVKLLLDNGRVKAVIMPPKAK